MLDISLDVLRQRLLLVSVYSNVFDSPFLAALKNLIFCHDDLATLSLYSKLYAAALEEKAVLGTALHIESLLVKDDNPFTRGLALSEEIATPVLDAAKSELYTFFLLSRLDTDGLIKLLDMGCDVKLPEIYCGQGEFLCEDTDRVVEYLESYHKTHGCGIFIDSAAFVWDGGFRTILNPDPVTLYDLKGYESQRKRVVENTESLLAGFRVPNMLLYGDRGTGKSATMHALANEYFDRGLRILELPKERLCDLPVVCEELKELPYKFIIFVDDLSFDKNELNIGALKTVMEGSFSVKPPNVAVYATSNRRHLVSERHSDREDDVFSADLHQELLSLSDRFGITVTFLSPSKQEYLQIVSGIFSDMGISADEKILNLAERWALTAGGRSPRAARQFADFVHSRIKRGLPLEF